MYWLRILPNKKYLINCIYNYSFTSYKNFPYTSLATWTTPPGRDIDICHPLIDTLIAPVLFQTITERRNEQVSPKKIIRFPSANRRASERERQGQEPTWGPQNEVILPFRGVSHTESCCLAVAAWKPGHPSPSSSSGSRQIQLEWMGGVAYLHIASSPDAWRDVVVYTEPERRLAKCQYYFIGMNDGNKRDGFSKDQWKAPVRDLYLAITPPSYVIHSVAQHTTPHEEEAEEQ